MDRSWKMLGALAAVTVAIMAAATTVARGEVDVIPPPPASPSNAPIEEPDARVFPLVREPAAMPLDTKPAADAPLETKPAAAAPQGLEANCGGGCDTDLVCCPHLIVGAEAVWLSPERNQRFGSFDVVNTNTNAVLDHFSTDPASSEGLVATPRITLGVQNDRCWGAQVRYWRMDEPNTLNGVDPLLGTGGIGQSRFFAETIDLEVTRLFDCCDWPMQFTFGARYAQLQQSAGITAAALENGEYYSGSVLSGVEFSGAGITSSVSGLHPMGCGNFNLFYSLRASLVWDSKANNFVQTWADFESPINGFSRSYNSAYAGGNSDLFIGEIQVGGQWNYCLKCIPANAFLRVAFEYQYWGATNTGDTRAFSFAGSVPGPLVGVASGRSGDAYVNLVGFNVGTGITW